MTDDQALSPFADDANNPTQLLQGLISPAPAQALVAPPPDSPPPTRAAESTPVTGSLATPPSQATPKIAPAPLPAQQSAAGGSASAIAQQQTGLGVKIRRGLAGYFSGGTGAVLSADSNAPATKYFPSQTMQQSRGMGAPLLQAADRSSDPNYVKVESNGQTGYLPKANLAKAQQRDKTLRVLP